MDRWMDGWIDGWKDGRTYFFYRQVVSIPDTMQPNRASRRPIIEIDINEVVQDRSVAARVTRLWVTQPASVQARVTQPSSCRNTLDPARVSARVSQPARVSARVTQPARVSARVTQPTSCCDRITRPWVTRPARPLLRRVVVE